MRYTARPRRYETGKPSRPFTAKYNDTCGECGGSIRKGDTIVMFSSDSSERATAHHPLCASAAGGTPEQRAAQAEYNQGVRDYENDRFIRNTFGEEAAVAEEYNRYLRFGDDY